MPERCFERPDNCTDPDCQKKLVAAHSITEKEFDASLKGLYGEKPIPPPLTLLAAEVKALADVPCSANRIMFDLAMADIETNQNMKLTAVAGYERPKGETNSFSVGLFLGALQESPDRFDFYRGKFIGRIDLESATMLFKVWKGDQLLHICDISDAYP